jgi:ribosome-binding factor A
MLTKVIKSKLGKSISFRSTPKLDFAMQDLTDDNWLDKIN